MAEDLDEDTEEFPEEDLDEEDLDEEDIADDLDFVDADLGDDAVEVIVPDGPKAKVVVDEEEEDTAVRKRVRREDEDEEEEEELDPDDIEADLDTILKDRLVASDDDDEEEEEEEPSARSSADDTGIVPKREGEFVCPGCFLLVHRGQFGRSDQLTCPSGEDPCPAINRFLGKKVAKKATRRR